MLECSCHDVGISRGRWNATCGTRWNRLRTALTRRHPALEFFRAVEVQKRGLLHLHVIVWSPEPVDVYVVQRLAIAAGFGCNVDMPAVAPGDVASYVSKYVSKGADSRLDVPWDAPWVDEETGEIRYGSTLPTFRTWSSSSGWGCRMADVKASIRAAWERARVVNQPLTLAAEVVGALAVPTLGASPP